MKAGDLVRFITPSSVRITNNDHTQYYSFKNLVGIVTSVERVWRPTGDEYLGAKVIVSFGEKKPRAFTEYSLEVISAQG